MQTSPPIPSPLLEQWLPTGPAARALGCSADTLKRYADRDEFLVEGQHWRHGPYRQSPRVWNIQACHQAISWQGRLGSRIAQA